MAKRKVVSNSEDIVPIPMPIDVKDAKRMGFSKKDMVYRRIGRKVYSCILVPGTRQQQADWLREFDNERKAEDRNRRC